MVSMRGEAGKVLDNKGSSYVEMSTIDNLDSQRWVLEKISETSSLKPEDPNNKREEYYTVSTPCQNLLLRKAANNKSEVIGKMPKGSKVIVTSIDNNGWASVEFQGQKGYAFAKFLTKGE